MERVYDIILKILRFIVGILGIVMILSVVLQVAGRYLPFGTVTWTEELARLTFLWFSFLAITIAYYYKGHMGINFFVLKMNKKIQKFLYYTTMILVLIFSLIITYYGINLTILAKAQTSPMLHLSFSWFYACVPVGFGLISLFSFFSIIENILQSNKTI